MGIKASACAALIVAAGIMSCLLSPSRAQESTDQAQATANSTQPVALGKPVSLNKYSKHRSRHSRRHTRKSSRMAKNEASKSAAKSSESKSAKTTEQAKSTDDKTADSKTADSKVSEKKTADGKLAKNTETSQPLPISVANARAEMLSPAASTTSNEPTAATPAPAQAPASAVVASDQLNNVDRSLTETRSPPAAAIAMASLSTPLPTATASKDDSTWANTSLIGKIFIAFGGLLTLASAARMMIA